MNDLEKALGDISSIRRDVARSTQFHGYGPATLAATSAFAVLAAVAQAVWLPDPARDKPLYLVIWITTAVISVGLTGVQMYRRTCRVHSGLSDEMIRTAVEQFVPSLAAGLLMTPVLAFCVPASFWMLPGLWQVIFSLGIFSSCRFLPRPMIAAGAWYLLSGLVSIALGGNRALVPWTMGFGYGAGQLLVSVILLVGATEGGHDD